MNRIGALLTATLLACAGDHQLSQTVGPTELFVGPTVGECGPIETNAFGIYSSPTGKVTIDIGRAGTHVLVLSAHDATTWEITTSDPSAVIDEVYALGYDDQTIDVSQLPNHPKVTVDSQSTTGHYGCGYSWPYDDKGCDTGDMLRLAAYRIDRSLNSYDGCYSTDSILLDDHMHTYDACTTSYEDGLPRNHFIADCRGGDEGSCGYEGGGEGSGSGSGSNGNGGGGGGGGGGVYL